MSASAFFSCKVSSLACKTASFFSSARALCRRARSSRAVFASSTWLWRASAFCLYCSRRATFFSSEPTRLASFSALLSCFFRAETCCLDVRACCSLPSNSLTVRARSEAFLTSALAASVRTAALRASASSVRVRANSCLNSFARPDASRTATISFSSSCTRAAFVWAVASSFSRRSCSVRACFNSPWALANFFSSVPFARAAVISSSNLATRFDICFLSAAASWLFCFALAKSPLVVFSFDCTLSKRSCHCTLSARAVAALSCAARNSASRCARRSSTPPLRALTTEVCSTFSS